MKRKSALKRRRNVFVKFLMHNNMSPVQEFQYPKRIRPGYITDKYLGVPVVCEVGWHFVNTIKNNASAWWDCDSKCYVVIPVGKTISKKDKYDGIKWAAQQLIFAGQIDYRKLKRAYFTSDIKYDFLQKEAEKILTKWEKINGRNGKLFLAKLRQKEQASKRM